MLNKGFIVVLSVKAMTEVDFNNKSPKFHTSEKGQDELKTNEKCKLTKSPDLVSDKALEPEDD